MEANIQSKVTAHEHYSRKFNARAVHAVYPSISQPCQTRLRMQYPLIQGLQLYPVPPAHGLSVGTPAHRPGCRRPEKKEIGYHAIYHHYRKWSNDGSLERVFQHSILSIREDLDTQHLNLDGSHALAKKGGEAVA
jgi:hypothetical protein